MKNERPLAGGEEARVSIGADAITSTANRRVIQANPAMRQRLSLLLWSRKLEIDHDG